MHEMSLAQNLISRLERLAEKHGLAKVIRVQVEVGPFAGVVVDSFEFGFNILAAENELTRDAVLEIIRPQPTFVCHDCGELYDQDEKRPTKCNKCQTGFFIPNGGGDLTLLQVEME